MMSNSVAADFSCLLFISISLYYGISTFIGYLLPDVSSQAVIFLRNGHGNTCSNSGLDCLCFIFALILPPTMYK